jgi:hypothetical protein
MSRRKQKAGDTYIFSLYSPSCREKLSDNYRLLPKGSYRLANEQNAASPEAGEVQIYGLALLWLIYQTVSEEVFSETQRVRGTILPRLIHRGRANL